MSVYQLARFPHLQIINYLLHLYKIRAPAKAKEMKQEQFYRKRNNSRGRGTVPGKVRRDRESNLMQFKQFFLRTENCISISFQFHSIQIIIASFYRGVD